MTFLRATTIAISLILAATTPAAYAAQKTVSVPMLKRAVKPGDIISGSDLKMTTVDARKANVHAVQSNEDILGMAARRPLLPGRVLRQSDFQVPSVIEKGSLVTMVLFAGGLRLTAMGTAMEDGSDGNYIRLKNSVTRQIVQGRILAPNLVEVLPVGQLALR